MSTAQGLVEILLLQPQDEFGLGEGVEAECGQGVVVCGQRHGDVMAQHNPHLLLYQHDQTGQGQRLKR